MSHQEHRERANDATGPAMRCGIITISDTRTTRTDTSGAAIRAALTQAGHDVVKYELARDEPDHIVTLVQAAELAGCQVIITSGGTGIARRDTTIEALDKLLDKRLPGFGELFRMLSYQDIGAAAMLSRATAGVYKQSLIFCLPGSTGAVTLALQKLILPELPHLVWEVQR
jgi:molybdenum cofactor biosynthesis protein B